MACWNPPLSLMFFPAINLYFDQGFSIFSHIFPYFPHIFKHLCVFSTFPSMTLRWFSTASGGKVLVSTQEHIQRLIAIRLQAFFGPAAGESRNLLSVENTRAKPTFQIFPIGLFDKSSLTIFDISNSLTVSDLRYLGFFFGWPVMTRWITGSHPDGASRPMCWTRLWSWWRAPMQRRPPWSTPTSPPGGEQVFQVRVDTKWENPQRSFWGISDS